MTSASVVAVLVGCGESEPADNPREVTVVGNGEVRGAPDVLNAQVGVQVTAADVSGALNAANERAKAVIDAVKGAGVPAEDVQTSQVNVEPEYATPGRDGGPRTVTGYRAGNFVRITVRELSKASQVIDTAVRAGGDAARLNGVNFALDDDSKLLADARERAFNDAKARAEQYARLSGLGLKNVLTISEAGPGSNEPLAKNQRDSAPMAAVPLEPGQETVRFTVTVKWELG